MAFVCLVYHRICSSVRAQRDPFTVHLAQFRAQMAWLARRGYRGVTVSEALQKPRDRFVALSFDDGYADFLQAVWPVLDKFGFHATLFVVAGRLGGTADWQGGDEAPLMNGAELHRLAAAGLEIACHGWRHERLNTLSEEIVTEELARARELLQDVVGQPVNGFAYPYGAVSPAARDAAAAAGFSWAATSRGGRNGTSTRPLRLRRSLVRGNVGRAGFALLAATGYTSWVEVRMDVRRMP